MSKSNLDDIKEVIAKIIDDVRLLESEENLKVNYVCFTGDLIQRGDYAYSNENQIELAFDNFIAPLLNTLNIDPQNFFIVPGNHEVDITKIDQIIENGLSASITDNDSINKIMQNIDAKYIERISYFYDFEKIFHENPVWSSSLNKTYIDECCGVKIGFACFNTAWRSTGSGIKDRNKMILGEKEVQKAFDSIKHCNIKIALMHHPSYWLYEEDKFACDPLLNQFDIVLSGHLHSLEDKFVISYGYSTVYSGSGSIYPIGEYYNGYSLLSIQPYTREVRVYLRKYFTFPRKKFDKSLFHNENGYLDFQLNIDNKSLAIGYKAINCLRDEFTANVNKTLVSNIVDDHAPSKLQEIFVQPVLKLSSEYEKEKDQENITLEDLINSNENIMFIGKKETGKTTILHYLALIYINDFTTYNKIPFIIDFKYLHTGNNIIEKCMLQFLLTNSSNKQIINMEQLCELLSTGSCVILIDNLSLQKKNDLSILSKFVSKYPNNRYIFTVHENILNSIPIKSLPDIGCSYKKVFIQTLTKNGIRNLMQKWVGHCEVDIDQFLDRIIIYFYDTGMPRTPLLVSLMLAICSRNQNYVPINEASVMERFMEILLEKLSADEVKSSAYDFKNKEDYLSFLAWKMVENNRFYFTKDEFWEITIEYHRMRGFDLKLSQFDTIFFDKNILVDTYGVISFRYQCMVEFYIAKRARKDRKAFEWIIDDKNYLNFINELSYLTGLERDCEEVLIKVEEKLAPIIKKSEYLLSSLKDYDLKTCINVETDKLIKDLKDSELNEEQRDNLTDKPDSGDELHPREMRKDIDVSKLSELDAFFNTLLLYGKVIKNSEDLTFEIKSKALTTCINCYCVLLGATKKLIEDQISNELIDKTIEKVGGKKLEDNKSIIDLYQDILKITVPIVLQNIALETLGTNKLATIIRDKIENESTDEFAQFMYVFLYSDLRLPESLSYIERFLKNSESKDIIYLSLFKLIYYYHTGYFKSKAKHQLESIIADSILKLKRLNKAYKSNVIMKIRKSNDNPQELLEGF